MATAKKLPSGSWRCLVFSHYENLFNEDGSPMIDEKTGKQKRKRIYESFTSDLQEDVESGMQKLRRLSSLQRKTGRNALRTGQ